MILPSLVRVFIRDYYKLSNGFLFSSNSSWVMMHISSSFLYLFNMFFLTYTLPKHSVKQTKFIVSIIGESRTRESPVGNKFFRQLYGNDTFYLSFSASTIQFKHNSASSSMYLLHSKHRLECFSQKNESPVLAAIFEQPECKH